MVRLEKMTQEEFAAFKTWMIEDYAKDISNNYRIFLHEAREGSAKEIEGMLSQGISTSNPFLYNIVFSEKNKVTPIGYQWIDVNKEKKRCFIPTSESF